MVDLGVAIESDHRGVGAGGNMDECCVGGNEELELFDYFTDFIEVGSCWGREDSGVLMFKFPFFLEIMRC